MKIGVISDTHISGRAKRLPDIVLDSFAGADHIIHAGDIGELSVLTVLEGLAPLTAVAGNIDTAESWDILGKKRIVTLGQVTVGVVHGHGEKGRTLDRAIGSFEAQAVRCVVFGHSHIPYCGYHGGVLLFNPGSPTDKRRNPYYSFGILEINGEEITPRLVFFDRAGRVCAG